MESAKKSVKGGEVIYKEDPGFKTVPSLVEILEKSGYLAGDYSGAKGIIGERCLQNEIGILKEKQREKSDFLGRKKEEIILSWLGTIRIRKEGAKIDEKWIISVFGRKNVEEIITLAEKLIEKFGVDVEVVLASETLKYGFFRNKFCSGY